VDTLIDKKDESATKKIKLKKIKSLKKGNENNEAKKLNKGKKKKVLVKILKVLLFTFIATAIIGFGIVLGVLNEIINKTDSIGPEELALLKLNTFIYDKDGKEIQILFSNENRIVASYNQMPQNLIDAVVAIEDERYWQHNGVDIKRTTAAVFMYITNGGSSSFGGSTITQQLVKTVTKDNETNWTRKIREWYRAIVLEKRLDKKTILESYLNTIYIGAGANGVETAAQIYFAKNIEDINLAEAACIAAAIQTPEGTNPYRGEKNKDKLLARQKVVLKKMLELGNITEVEYKEALEYKLVFKKAEAHNNAVQSYFVDAVIEAVISDLVEAKNITRDVALKMIYSNGYKIYSTMDSNVQKAINKAYDNSKLFYKDSKGGFMQSALVTMDHRTGNVLGIMGRSRHQNRRTST